MQPTRLSNDQAVGALLIGEDAYLVARPFIDELSGKHHIVFVGQL
jgi:hypothetical protein